MRGSRRGIEGGGVSSKMSGVAKRTCEVVKIRAVKKIILGNARGFECMAPNWEGEGGERSEEWP